MSGPGDGTEQEATAPAEASSPLAGPDDGAAAQVEAEAPAGAESQGDGATGDGGKESDDAPDPAAADADAGGDAADSEPDPEADLRERAGKADGYLDLAQRTQADFDNYRKRMTREVRAAQERGIGRLARELLPALDNLERALAAVESADHEHHLTQGIRLVATELSAALGRTGIQAYDPKGERFDPTHHEAVAQQPFEGAEPGTVAQVLQPGYRLNETILRPARVIVAS